MAQTIIFDSLAYARKLKDAGFNEQQAEVLAESQVELIENNLATKQDLKELETRLVEKLLEHKLDVLKWTIGLLLAQTGILVGVFFTIAKMLK